MIPSRAAFSTSTSASEIMDRHQAVFVLLFYRRDSRVRKDARVVALSRQLDHVSDCVRRKLHVYTAFSGVRRMAHA